MKKLLVALGMALIAAVPISASKRDVAIKTRKESNQKDRVERPRAPMHIHLFCGPTINKKTNKRSMESKFYAQFFPGTYQIGFSLGLDGNFSFSKIHIDGDDHVCIDCGLVYGAIKYKNQWRGARIYKLHKN